MIASHNRDCSVVGVDFNPDYVRYAEDRRGEAALTNLTFEQGDIRRLRYADASFDVIWSRFVLYFLPDPEAAISEFKRLLRPGGIAILSLHNWPSLLDFPDDKSLRERRARALGAIADTGLALKAPAMLTVAGFADIAVEIELDPIYTAIGAIGADNRRNYADVLAGGRRRVADALGGEREADLFATDLLAYLDRPDTYTYSLLWTIEGRVPFA
jgi:SAM-dependent methyltransferase